MKRSVKITLFLTILLQAIVCSATPSPYASNTYDDKHSFEVSESKSSEPFDRLIVFGDSLSDTGNLYKRFLEIFPMSPPYFEGHFSNGPVWIDFIAKKYNIPSEAVYNYAFGGARAVQATLPLPGLESQVDKYIATSNNQANAKSLYVIWIGANDIVFDKQAGVTPDPAKMSQVITAQIEKLEQIGAKNFLILDLPNLGFSPEAFATDKDNENTEYSQKLQKISQEFNSLLITSLQATSQKYQDLTLLSFDTYTFLEGAINNAQNFGITNTKDRCNPNWYATPLKPVCDKPEEYIFWDAVHPTSRAHEILADAVSIKMQETGYSFITEWNLTEEDKNVSKSHNEAIAGLMEENISETVKKAIFDIFH